MFEVEKHRLKLQITKYRIIGQVPTIEIYHDRLSTLGYMIQISQLFFGLFGKNMQIDMTLNGRDYTPENTSLPHKVPIYPLMPCENKIGSGIV